MKKIAIITTGYFPIPPTMGGAVESLVYTLILQNETYKKTRFVIYTVADEKAEKIAKEHKYTRYRAVNIPWFVKIADKMIYNFVTYVLKKNKNMSYRYILQRIWFEWKVSADLKKNDYDEVIVENTPASFLALKFRNNNVKYRGRYHYHLHNDVGGTFGCASIIEDSASVIGISSYINENFKKQFPAFKGRTEILKNCVVSNMKKAGITSEEIKKKYGISDEDTIFLYAGRISEEKGVYELLRAYKAAKLNNAKLLIVGGSYYASDVESAYEKKVRSIASDMPDVLFTGYVEHEDLNIFYETADVAVFPAVWNEPAGLTIIEAMKKGLPVITTNSGGIPEYVGNENVILLERGKNMVKDLTESLKLLYNDKELRKVMGNKAATAATRYSEDAYYKNFIELLGK